MGVSRLQSPPTLREATVEHLRNEIITGKLKPGELLKEVELSAQLGLSPTPVREALVQLAGQGLVEIESNRLKRVAPLNINSMRELMSVQRVLWETGYIWGVPRVGSGELAAMESTFHEYNEALSSGDVRAAFLAYADFHSIVVAASGNNELGRMIAERFGLVERFVILRMADFVSQELLEKNRKIYEALKQGNQALAITLGEDIRATFANKLASVPDEF